MFSRKLYAAAILILAASNARAHAQETTHYTGSINGDLKVVVALTSTGKVIEGSYLYARHAGQITLKGGRDGKNVSLTESTDDGKLPGTFALADGPDGALVGAWKSADGKKSLAVTLTPVAKTMTLVSELKGMYAVKTEFLHFGGDSPFHAALNKNIEAEATVQHNDGVKSLKDLAVETMNIPGEHAMMPLTQDRLPELFFADDSLVSIRTLVCDYTGGAHSNYTYDEHNFQWKNNKLVKLDTAQIVAATTPGLKALRDLCVKELKTQKASWPEQAEFNTKQLPTLNFTADALVVSFGPYDVGPYAEGPHTVALPWASVKGVLGDKSAVKGLGE